MADNDSHVKALSHRMLQGWKLLAETCPVPGCNVPLMRPPGEREQYECVKCGGTFDAALRRVRSQSEVTRREHHDEEMAVESEGEESAASAGEEEAEAALVTGDASRFGPFARTSPKASPPPFRPAGSPGAKSPSPMAALSRPTTNQQAAAERRKRSDLASTAIAAKLLEGWALLNDYCPMDGCMCPLMRNRQKRLFCVSCDLFVVRAGDVEQHAAQRASEAAERKAGTPEAKAAPPATPQAAAKAAPKEVKAPEPLRPAPVATTAAAVAAAPLAGVAERTSRTLLTTIADAERALAAAADPRAKREQAGLIHECAAAIVALQSVDARRL